MKKAIVIGSTGMVGTQLIQLLLKSTDYSEIVSLVRRPSGVVHSKLQEHCVNFDKPETWKQLVKGDVLFSTLGTTLATAKSKDAQFKVDYTYQYIVAQIAARNNVATYVLVSSVGANSSSMVFYSNMKGKLEEAVKILPFRTINILRPGQLDGNRIEKRRAEAIGLKAMYLFNKAGLLKKYRPIQAWEVALAMLKVASYTNSGEYTLDEVFELIK